MTPDAYRAPMRSRRALDLRVVGVRRPDDARSEARLQRFCAVAESSFVWTRLGDAFHLGRVVGPCHEASDPEALGADLVHVRPCDWLPEPVDPALVPEQVSYAFSRGGRNFQRIGLPGAAAATERVWHLLG